MNGPRYRFATAVAGLLAASAFAPTAPADVTVVDDDAALRAALRAAGPGDTVRLRPGVYRGGIGWSPRGEPGRRVTLTGDEPDDPPVIRGGAEGLKLTRPRHAVLSDLILEGATGNGFNADDGGRKAEPAGPLTLRRLTVRDSGGAGGNLDGFKLSGVDGLRMEECAALRWGAGGQGIDLVGCHDAEVRRCRVDGGAEPDDAGPAVGLQAKGGCRNVLFADCRVEGVTERCVNLGGRTGAAYFRPADAPHEAADVTVRGCELVGGAAAVAFVGSDGGRVEDCVLYGQTRFPFRILRENRADGLTDTRGGAVVGNLIVWKADTVWTLANVGGGTAPETFTFAGNVWFNAANPRRSRRSGLPGTNAGNVYGVDPKLADPPADLTPGKTPAELGAGVPGGEP